MSQGKALFYPPLCDVVSFGFAGIDNGRTQSAARIFADWLVKLAEPFGERVPMRILGPAPNAVGKVNGRYRYSLLVKCVNSVPLRLVVEQSLKRAYTDKAFDNVHFYADINGLPE